MIFDDATDLVFTNGVVYTADEQDAVYQAVAIKDGRIVFVGNDDEIADYVGSHTQIINLQEKMMIPAMIDTHIHPPGLVLSELYEVQLFGITSLEGYIEAIKQFINQHPGIRFLVGGGRGGH